ncbi:hypothetical protein [Modestobacter versicolor]|uniref:hypothetical protein n=1 Tax=Modestobacter versicolor TaxID=429133 RepID=UPI0034DF4FD7
MRLPDLRPRRAVPAALLAAVLLLTGCGGGSAASEADAPGTSTSAPRSTSAAPTTTAPPTPTQLVLPTGGTRVFPEHRLVGFSGAPGSAALGPMTGDLAAATQRLRDQAVPYGADRTVLPTYELIATTAHPFPGPAGTFSGPADDAVVQQYLDAARAGGGILLLGIQPGNQDFLPAVQHYERWLKEPDVGVALDPEWAVDPGQVPGDVFGSTTGAELDSVSAYLDGLVTTHRLPQKVMLYHQLHAQIVTGQEVLVDRPGVAVVKSVDGIGAAADKVATYQRVMEGTPPFVHAGFKLFYEEDTRSGPLMDPAAVLALVPQPEYVLYE